MALVRFGKIVRAIGLKGELGVAGSDGGLAEVDSVVLRAAGTEQRLKVLEARPQGKVWVLRLEAGPTDRTGAEARVGAEVWAERDELGEAGEDRHYWGDLQGLPVTTVDGRAVGTVTGLMETGAVDVLVVTGPGGEVLVPLAPYVEIDRQAGRIVVDPPEGLLDAGRTDGEGGPTGEG